MAFRAVVIQVDHRALGPCSRGRFSDVGSDHAAASRGLSLVSSPPNFGAGAGPRFRVSNHSRNSLSSQATPLAEILLRLGNSPAFSSRHLVVLESPEVSSHSGSLTKRSNTGCAPLVRGEMRRISHAGIPGIARNTGDKPTAIKAENSTS